MGSADSVRASRDGDAFHYHWAARQALRLLDFDSDLTAVSIEGLPEGQAVDGEEVIDLAEFYGGATSADCTTMRIVQLKHSTVRVDEPIVASELETTLRKFARIYRQAAEEGRAAHVEFSLVARRTLNSKVRQSFEEIAAGGDITYPPEAAILRRYMDFGGDAAGEAEFVRRLDLNDGAPGLLDLRDQLEQELAHYLPGGGTGSEMRLLVERVAQCATSISADQTLQLRDVLTVLRTTEARLFPAPSLIENIHQPIATADLDRFVATVITGQTRCILATAPGGSGKSILTTMLPAAMPTGSVTVVYDCFAGGDYRKRLSHRHEHRVALTQIANEIAARGLCTPLIPTNDASATDYLRVFKHRVETAAKVLGEQNPGALLTVVIDAADNAALYAHTLGDQTFVGDLLGEDWPSNVRMVELSRPERTAELNLPATGVTPVALRGFEEHETSAHLNGHLPEATAQDGEEFHALTGGNPRVQAMAMTGASSVASAMGSLQVAGAAGGNALDAMFANQVATVTEHLPDRERSALCQALAVLHPPMPVELIAAVAEIDAGVVRSFATDLGRGLHLSADTLQFRDEPTETFFRDQHYPAPERLREFVRRVSAAARTSPHAASALPQLLFEAEMYTELVALAQSPADVPVGVHELQAQEIVRARTRFALSAMLRAERWADAAVLAVHAGDVSSGHSRRIELFRVHADLAADFLGAEAVEELCETNQLSTNWPGSNLHVEALLLSRQDGQRGLARSRARSAFDNMVAITRARQPGRRYGEKDFDADDVADLARAITNIDGVEAAVDFLCRWKPGRFVHGVAARFCARLADHGQYDEVQAVAAASDATKRMRLAAAETMYDYNVIPGADTSLALLTMLQRRKRPFAPAYDLDRGDMRAIVWTLVNALRAEQVDRVEALRILDIHLPATLPTYAGSPHQRLHLPALLLAHALRAHLRGHPVALEQMADEELVASLAKPHISDHSVREFGNNITPSLPWIEQWLTLLLDGVAEATPQPVDNLFSNQLPRIADYDVPYAYLNTLAEVATRLLTGYPDSSMLDRFSDWHSRGDAPLTRSRLSVIRVASRQAALRTFALTVLTRGERAALAQRSDAGSRIDELVGLARAVLASSPAEAKALFLSAVHEADLVGDDLYIRWHALTRTAHALATGTNASRCYRLFQIGEHIDTNVNEIDVAELAARLHAMHRPTYLSATSRARDRRTLSFRHMLVPAFQDASSLPGFMALYAFDLPCAWRPVADSLLDTARVRAHTALNHYTRHRVAHPSNDQTPLPTRTSDEPDMAAEYGNADFTRAATWNEVLTRFDTQWYERRRVLSYALERDAAVQPEILDALTASSAAHHGDFEEAARLALTRTQTPGLRAAQRRLATTMATRFARTIATQIYDDPHFDEVATAGGYSSNELRRIAMAEIGSSAYDLKHEDYFRLAAGIATTLGPDDAVPVFDAFAALFEDLVPADVAGDGRYDQLAPPPEDPAAGLAELLWAALGDMAAAVRWQAAHAVLLLITMDRRSDLRHVAAVASSAAGPRSSVDSRMHFYALHARMWLLLALARGAREDTASALADFVPWLFSVCEGAPHAVNQLLAQDTLKSLVAVDLFPLSDGQQAQLARRLSPAAQEMDWDTRAQRKNPYVVTGEPDDKRERFFFDFERYWCWPLADAFGTTEGDVARRAAELATTLDGYDERAAGREARGDAGVFSEGATYPDHGSWPAEDRLSTYLAVHSLLSVGAELAASFTVYRDPDLEYDSYDEWLARFIPTRGTGRWLADRRDAPPSPLPDADLRDGAPPQDWVWMLNRSDFERTLGLASGWVTVHASWQANSLSYGQDTSVSSAMVAPELAQSFVAAAQTNPAGAPAVPIPTVDSDHDQHRHAPFQLSPWLDDSQRESGVDRTDAAGADVRFPPPRPAASIIEKFQLVSDADQRVWTRDGTPVMRSRVWSSRAHETRDRDVGSWGASLEIESSFLGDVLTELAQSLVVQVNLRRDHHSGYGHRKDQDEFDWLERSGIIYLIDSSGRCVTY